MMYLEDGYVSAKDVATKKNMISGERKNALLDMIKDYCDSEGHVFYGCHHVLGDEATNIYIDEPGNYYRIEWKDVDNIYKTLQTIIKDIEKPKKYRQFYLSTARGGKSWYEEQYWSYLRNDVENAHYVARARVRNIKDVIFNPPATIILWMDGTKTVVKAQNCEPYDPEKGFAMAVTKKHFGNEGNYYTEVKKWVDRYEEKLKEQQRAKDEAEGLLCKLTLPDISTATEAVKNLTKALRGDKNSIESDSINKSLDDSLKEIDSLINKIGEDAPDDKKIKLSELNELIEYIRCCHKDGDCDECPYGLFDNCGNCDPEEKMYKYLKEYRDLLKKEISE